MSDNTKIISTIENAISSQSENPENLKIKETLMAAGVVATTGAAVYGTYTLVNTNQSEPIIPTEENNQIVSSTIEEDKSCIDSIHNEESNLSVDSISSDFITPLSFAEVFKNARKTLGENAIFEWNGAKYSTNYQETNLVETPEGTAVSEVQSRDILPEVEKIQSRNIVDFGTEAPKIDIQTQKNELPDLFDNTSVKSAAVDQNIEMKFGKLDSNNDGKWDTIVIDKNNDGKIDIMAMDEDNDGTFETFMINDNNDGTLDRMIIDANHNGIDSNDISESISYEIDMNDYDQVSENDPGFDQFDILGGFL